MSGETATMSSSGNITMLIYNANEDDCSYVKWERRLECGLQLKGVSCTLKDYFKCPTEAQAIADSQGGSIQKRYGDSVKAKNLIRISSVAPFSFKKCCFHVHALSPLSMGVIIKYQSMNKPDWRKRLD